MVPQGVIQSADFQEKLRTRRFMSFERQNQQLVQALVDFGNSTSENYFREIEGFICRGYLFPRSKAGIKQNGVYETRPPAISFLRKNSLKEVSSHLPKAHKNIWSALIIKFYNETFPTLQKYQIKIFCIMDGF